MGLEEVSGQVSQIRSYAQNASGNDGGSIIATIGRNAIEEITSGPRPPPLDLGRLKSRPLISILNESQTPPLERCPDTQKNQKHPKRFEWSELHLKKHIDSSNMKTYDSFYEGFSKILDQGPQQGERNLKVFLNKNKDRKDFLNRVVRIIDGIDSHEWAFNILTTEYGVELPGYEPEEI